MPRQVAEFLELSDAHRYTGHSWRVTSTTMLADAGATREELKRHGKWKSDRVADRYIAESLFDKEKTAKMITQNMQSYTAPTTNVTTNDAVSSSSSKENTPNVTNIYRLNNCSNLTFNK